MDNLLGQLLAGLGQKQGARFEDGSVGPRRPAPKNGNVRFEDGSVGQRRPAPAYGNARFEDGSVGMQRPQPQQFKMYEDMSFQGDPRQFMQQNPGFQFYEDGSFAPPQARGYQAPAQRDFPGRTNYGVPQDNMIDTPQGYVTREQYNMQQISQDPLAELRRFLGF